MSWASGGQPFIYGQPMTGMQSATMSAATAAGFTNPGIGYAGASQVAASIYNPTTSLAMRQMGYGVTPRQAQGSANMNPNSMGQVVQSMLQRWYGGKTSVSSSTLNAALAQGGIGALNLQALGLNPQTMTPIMQGYNDLYQKGVSASQANTLFTNAEMSTNTSTRNQAFQQLQKYGLPTSMLQQLKNSQAELTGRDTETSQGFNQGLSAAASSLNLFNSALNSLLNGPLGKLAGVAGGFGGGIGGSSVGGLLNKGLDLAGAAGIGKVLLGGSGGSGILSKVGSYIGDLFKGGGGGGGEMLSGIFGGAITAGGSSLSSSASSQSGGSSATSGTVTNKQVVTAVKDAESQLGKPYVWGGDSPATSFDCSGLVQWAYGQAGVKLPRTSQQQWASLQSKSVPMDKVQEGDLVFMAGSDGTANNPGHVGMMINSKQLIQAPYTGASIDVIAYDPGQWQHAARPVGGTSGVSNGSSAPTANASGQGNSGAGAGNTMGLLPGNYGSSEESANTASALAGGIATGGGGVWGGTGNSQTGATGSGGTNAGSSGGTDASASSLQKYAFSLFGKFGWGANQQQPLVNLWNKESNWRSNAQNPTSTAYGIAQFLNSTWAGYGPKTSNADLQILYGEEYIKQRYGSPAGAWAHETAYNWYGSGTGGAQAGLALVGDRGPEIVNFSGGEKVANASQTAAMLTGSAAGAAQAPWRTGPLASLWMANTPQNQSQMSGKCDINFNFPANAISVQVASLSNTSDISSAVSQMVNGLTTAMAQSSLVQNIANGNKG
jgi:cell wall-associated NlpC family hydrolase